VSGAEWGQEVVDVNYGADEDEKGEGKCERAVPCVLHVGVPAHVCRKKRRGRRCVCSNGGTSTTGRVHKGKCGRIEKGCRMGSTIHGWW
jgi:hypothetical protein